MSTLIEQYHAELLERQERERGGIHDMPTALVETCVEVLAVDAAGISLVADLRIPLAASNAQARTAEQIQVTHGDGPCLEAARQGRSMVFNRQALARNWPIFLDDLSAETGFHSVASMPLSLLGGVSVAAIDLFMTAEDVYARTIDPASLDLIGDLASLYLFNGSADDSVTHGLGRCPKVANAENRMNVWRLVGRIVAVDNQLVSRDALALLRAYAYRRDLRLDDLVALSGEGKLTATAVLADLD